MNKLSEKLKEIKKRKRIGLMSHVVVGYPSLRETFETVKSMAECGVDMIELQIPFSDPLADGSTIMKACEASLANGTKVSDSFKIMKELSEQIQIPFLFMSYYNIIYKYGIEKFCRDAEKAGASGLIVPDMPIDEEGEEHFFRFAREYNLFVIQVVSPASTDARLEKTAKLATGFVYCTARQGTTGAKDVMDKELTNYLERVRRFFNIPLAVGFGISKREHVKSLVGHADIAVVGSAVIDVINKSNKEDMESNIRRFISDLQVE